MPEIPEEILNNPEDLLFYCTLIGSMSESDALEHTRRYHELRTMAESPTCQSDEQASSL